MSERCSRRQLIAGVPSEHREQRQQLLYYCTAYTVLAEPPGFAGK